MIKQKNAIRSIEREDERRTAQNYDELAKNSLTLEGVERKSKIDRMKVELKQDYQDRYARIIFIF